MSNLMQFPPVEIADHSPSFYGSLFSHPAGKMSKGLQISILPDSLTITQTAGRFCRPPAEEGRVLLGFGDSDLGCWDTGNISYGFSLMSCLKV